MVFLMARKDLPWPWFYQNKQGAALVHILLLVTKPQWLWGAVLPPALPSPASRHFAVLQTALLHVPPRRAEFGE